MNRFTLFLVVSTMIDTLVALVSIWMLVLVRGRRGRRWCVGIPEMAGAALVTAMFVLCKSLLLISLGLRLFALLHVLYLDVAIVVPLAGGSVLLAGRTGLPRLGRVRVTGAVAAAALLALAVAPVSAYATFIEPQRLETERVAIELDALAPARRDLTVAVLADLQFNKVTEHEVAAVRAAVEGKPDLIVLPGDIFQGSDEQFELHVEDVRQLLGQLDAEGGVYLVEGDCDSPQRLREAVRNTNVEFLFNRIVRTTVGGLCIAVAGIECAYETPDAMSTIQQLVQDTPGADLRLLVAHRPDVVLVLAPQAVPDLVLSGHTHGGQVQLPMVGPLMTCSRIPRAAAAGGASIVNGARLYVSRGVGCERGVAPRLRLFCPPEVSLLRLTHPASGANQPAQTADDVLFSEL